MAVIDQGHASPSRSALVKLPELLSKKLPFHTRMLPRLEILNFRIGPCAQFDLGILIPASCSIDERQIRVSRSEGAFFRQRGS